ncbi:hypothetical protein [Schlesneria paludicola]|uniref:hypothetical protein n=1 Tax=Schlesneria paludicola TaxID=360056 RepID=UPI00029AD1A4|nr:hypothetical protein [Schlesneria paludicola]
MRVSRAFFGSLVVASCHSFAFAQAGISDSELILGPIIPIGILEDDATISASPIIEPELGPVVPLAGTTAIEVRRLSAAPRLAVSNPELGIFTVEEASAPTPQVHTAQAGVIRQPAAAPTIQMVHRMAPNSPRPVVHPEQVRAHLTTAIQSLQTAGMAEEANQVLAIQQRFLQRQYQELLVAHKESQVQALQEEIARLKQSQATTANDAQVTLQLQLVRVNRDQRETLVKALREMSSTIHPSNPLQVLNPCATEGIFDVEGQAVRELVNGFTGMQRAKIVAEPSATVLNGRTVHFACEPESAMAAFVVTPRANRPLSRIAGSMFEVCPNVMPTGMLRVGLVADVACQLPKPIGDKDGNPMRRIRVETVMDLRPGRTLAFVGPSESAVQGQPNLEHPWCDLVVVTPTVIHGPASMPIPSHAAFPVEHAIPRPLIEAKAIKQSNSFR